MYDKQIIDLFSKEYSIILATTETHFQEIKILRKKIFSKRYNITPEFIEQKGYDLNTDDRQSFIYLLHDNIAQEYIGTVRCFFINTQTPNQILPMEKDGNVKDIDIINQNLPIIELSRAAIKGNIRLHSSLSAISLHTLLNYRLMIATRINFILYPSSKIFSIMEPSLHRILKKQKVNFQKIGLPVELYGTRTPYAIKSNKLLKDTEETMGAITRHYLKELCQNPDAFWEFIDNNPYLERSDIQLDRICQLFKEHGDNVDLSLLLGEDAASMA